MNNPPRRLVGIVAVVCGLGAADLLTPVSSEARANAVGSASLVGLKSCDRSAVSQPFAPWFDSAQYELVPGGDFENSAWSMDGGANRVAGSEPYAATGTLGAYSLALPAASSAQSPPTCVDTTSPSIRFFISGEGSVAVSVVDGSTVSPAGVAVASGNWAPTPVMLTSSAVMDAQSGGTARVSVAIRALSGSPRVDDVFIDPWSRG